MNDTENLVPQFSVNNENLPNQKTIRRKPLGKLGQKHPKSQPRRRALGDITNSARRPLQPLKQKLATPTASKLRIWQDDDDVPEPEIIPPAPPARPYEPAPLFTAREMDELRREIAKEEEEDDTDDFGRPFMNSVPVPIPPPPYHPDEGDDDIPGDREHGLNSDYFSSDQILRKEDFPVLELA